MINREANEKFLVGDSITNKELDELLSGYTLLLTAIQGIDDKFGLMASEVYRRVNTLEGYKSARNERRTGLTFQTIVDAVLSERDDGS